MASQSGKPIRAGTVIGRYVVIEWLGAGGMGVVLAAYDPKLDRKVAVKLLRAGKREGTDAETAQQRLLREAQAMAKLDHPNVVSVHDVGTHDGNVFVAMEFVRGRTLRSWCERPEEDRPWVRTLELMRQAGQGLIAAHEAGLVHRDFKPDNVMIGDDGRVRVMDFGLVRSERAVTQDAPDLTAGDVLEPGARTEEDAAVDAMGRIRARLAGLGKLGQFAASGDADTISDDDPAGAEVEPEHAFEGSLTRTGALLGTPAYMAPEQIEGRVIDAKADQFAFCVTLFEALCGARPFQGDTWTDLAAAILQGRMIEIPPDAALPKWLLGVLKRGLARKPEDRFADMHGLLAALEVRRPGNRRWIAAGLASAALATLGVLSAGDGDPCDDSAQSLAPVWTEARAAEVRNAFANAGDFGAEVPDRAVARLQHYADAWTEGWETACRAPHSQDLVDRRMACLDDRRRSLDALVDVLSDGTPSALEHGVLATARLPSLDHCADLDALVEPVEPPPSAQAEGVASIRSRLADAAALEWTGSYAEGVSLTQALLEEADATAYGPVIAETALQHGRLLDRARRPDDAAEALRRAASLARSSGADEVAAAAEVRLVFVVGVGQRLADEARWWADHAAAAVKRVGEDSPLEARRLNHLGVTEQLGGEPEKGAELLVLAVAAHESKLGPDHPDTLEALHNLGLVLRRAGKFSRSLETHREVLRRREALLGPRHPAVAQSLGAIGVVLQLKEDVDGAADAIERALEIVADAEDQQAARLMMDLATIRAKQMKFEQARELYAAARAVLERDLGATHPMVDTVEANVARVWMMEGDFQAAVDKFAVLVEARRKRLGAEHPRVGNALGSLGEAQLRLGDKAKAIDSLVEAQRLLAKGEPGNLASVKALLAEARAP